MRTIFKTKHTLKSSLMKTMPERDPQQTAQCIYSIPCECGRSYIGETSRPLAVRPREHRHSLEVGLLDKSKLAQLVYEECQRVGWDEARILEIGSNSRCRRYKESAHMACLTNPISLLSLDISPIWISLISNEVTNSQRRSLWRDRFFMGFCKVLVPSVQFFTPQMALAVSTKLFRKTLFNPMQWFSWTWFVC
jgi:hypothetical protein